MIDRPLEALLGRPLLDILVERDMNRQIEKITVDLGCFENLRRMTRQEFRALLRERLQEFGDKCLAVWDEKCGWRE